MREDLLRQIADYVKPYQSEGKGIKELSKASTDGTKAIQNKDIAAGDIAASSFLREININSDSYGKNGKSLVDDIPDNDAEERTRRNGFVMSVMNTTGKDVQEMQNQGLSAEDIDPKDFVTVSDKIKVSLAKAGIDVSSMGGLDSSTIEKVTGNASVASGIERSLKAADLPVESGTIKDVKEADYKLSEIENKLDSLGMNTFTEGSVKYLIKNTKEPSIDNVYQAMFSGNSTGEQSIQDAVQSTEIPAELEDSFGKVITEAGLKNNTDTLKEASWLLSQKLPVTSENMITLNKLINNPIVGKADIQNNIIDTVSEGKNPKDTSIVDGFSIKDLADEAVKIINSTDAEKASNYVSDSNVLSIRMLRMISAEIMAENNTGSELATGVGVNNGTDVSISTSESNNSQLSVSELLNTAKEIMTRESLVTLQKLGINIETTPITNIIDEIKNGENNNITEESLSLTDQDIYNQTISEAAEMSDFPAALIGSYKYIGSVQFQEVYESGQRLKNSLAEKSVDFEKISYKKVYNKMTSTYEAVGTEVRKDLGDSIKKAFQNVDDILDDMGYEKTEENQRAIRILGYNNLDITDENIVTVKAADTVVQKAINNLKPKTVLAMIKDGKNPLDMSMEELTEETDNYNEESQSENKKSEDVAEFLWKVEKNKDISDTEKQSYIGIYRLIHQVNESDGAVIGQLINQNVPVTMRNMMTAVRTKKQEGSDIKVDDNFGFTQEINSSELSITQQIELSFQKTHLKNAQEIITPSRLHAIGKEDTYMEMTPEQLDTSLQNVAGTTQEEETENQLWYEQRASEIKKSVVQEDKIYDMLDKMDIPSSVSNLAAANNMVSNGRKVFSQLAKYHVNDDGTVVDVKDPDISAMTQQIMEEYGEACKTPEEMAEAQEKLADQAENVMKNFLNSDNPEYIDLKAIQSMNKELSLYGKMAQDEIYHIPVMVADQNGVMTLKIVRGEENRGLVDIFIKSGDNINTRASFNADDKEVTGKIETTDKSQKEYFLDRLSELEERISKESDLKTHLEIKENDISDITDLYQRNVEQDETDAVSTKKLYSIARAFIDTLSQSN